MAFRTWVMLALVSLLLFVSTTGSTVASADTKEAQAPTCGPSCSARPRNFSSLKTCLGTAFPSNDGVRLGFRKLPKVTYPSDEAYSLARRTLEGNMLPAVVVMAESESDVISAVQCAVDAGYRVSPRGRGHHYQGLSNMDGYVVVDCSLLCDPDTFDVVKEGGDWILPGQKYIATVEGGSGCTNAVMLAAIHKNFEAADGALYAIGTCPSVGITGYTTGGGTGDITPYVGWGADDFLEARLVLWDGSVVTANQTHNSDLYWATQGGGSGFGVITSLKTVVPQAPEPSPGESSRKYCYVLVDYSTPDDESRKKFLNALQEYFYEVDPLVSSRFGGGGALNKESKYLHGIFLGSATGFLSNFGDNGLLDEDMLDASVNSTFMQDYEELCNGMAPCALRDDLPSTGVKIAEFSTYGEAMLYKLCFVLTPFVAFGSGYITYTQTSGDWCSDLGISQEFCTQVSALDLVSIEECMSLGIRQDVCEKFLATNSTYYEPDCTKPEVINGLLEAAYDPLSFFNQLGPPEWIMSIDYDDIATHYGGLSIPKVDIDTLMALDEVGINLNHLQHGAPMMKTSESTAYPWRDTAIMTDFQSTDHSKVVMSRMAEFYGDEGKLQGYYNYMNPIGNPNWRYYYFGENYERLAQIKLKYDPLNFFGNPMQVEPAISNETSDAVPESGETNGDTTSGSGRIGALTSLLAALNPLWF